MAHQRPTGFSITEYTVPAQYIREYPGGVKSDNDQARLAVKRYQPVQKDLAENAVTIVATHANGIAKEAYEALWEELFQLLPGKIRGVWFADCVHQGASGTLNQDVLGDDPNWFDHSRDLLVMINQFRDEMPRPLVGVGHSMGCAQLVQLALIHPRLLDSLVLIEPVIRPLPPPGPNAALPSSHRPEEWPSLAEAEASFRKSKFFRSWDSRCLDTYLQHGLQVIPDTGNGNSTAKQGRARLTTSKSQEAWSYVRPNFAPIYPDTAQSTDLERRRAPDLPTKNRAYQFDRAEMIQTDANLPNVRPHVLWIFADGSFLNAGADNEDKLKRTGTGIGGSGGVAEGNVKGITIAKSSHMLPFEKPLECAKALSGWLDRSLTVFDSVEKWWAGYDKGKSTNDMRLSKAWMDHVKHKEHTLRDGFKGKL